VTAESTGTSLWERTPLRVRVLLAGAAVLVAATWIYSDRSKAPQAPQKVPVFRKEIYLEIHREATGVVTAPDDGQPEKVAEVDESLRELGEGA